MRLRLPELQVEDQVAREIREKGLKESWEEIDGVVHREGLPYLPEIIRIEIINRHHDDPLAGHFGVKKTRELVARIYYWPTLRADIEAYVKGCDVSFVMTCHMTRHEVRHIAFSTVPLSNCQPTSSNSLPL